MARRKKNLSQLVRDTFTQGITKTSEVVAHILQQHGVAVRPGLVNNIKSTEKDKRQKPGRKPGPRPQTVSNDDVRVPSVTSKRAGGFNLDDISTVRSLLTRLGTNAVKELVTVLS